MLHQVTTELFHKISKLWQQGFQLFTPLSSCGVSRPSRIIEFLDISGISSGKTSSHVVYESSVFLCTMLVGFGELAVRWLLGCSRFTVSALRAVQTLLDLPAVNLSSTGAPGRKRSSRPPMLRTPQWLSSETSCCPVCPDYPWCMQCIEIHFAKAWGELCDKTMQTVTPLEAGPVISSALSKANLGEQRRTFGKLSWLRFLTTCSVRFGVSGRWRNWCTLGGEKHLDSSTRWAAWLCSRELHLTQSFKSLHATKSTSWAEVQIMRIHQGGTPPDGYVQPLEPLALKSQRNIQCAFSPAVTSDFPRFETGYGLASTYLSMFGWCEILRKQYVTWEEAWKAYPSCTMRAQHEAKPIRLVSIDWICWLSSEHLCKPGQPRLSGAEFGFESPVNFESLSEDLSRLFQPVPKRIRSL